VGDFRTKKRVVRQLTGDLRVGVVKIEQVDPGWRWQFCRIQANVSRAK
jgi:hypothetical protein